MHSLTRNPATLFTLVPLFTPSMFFFLARAADTNSSLGLATGVDERQSYSTFYPATPACPPRCPASAAEERRTPVPAIVAGMCVVVGIAGAVGGLGFALDKKEDDDVVCESEGEEEKDTVGESKENGDRAETSEKGGRGEDLRTEERG